MASLPRVPGPLPASHLIARRCTAIWARLLLGVGVALLGACGPVTTTQAIMDAEVALEAAASAQAGERAVYEFTLAQLCLQKAREEEGYSEYQAAIELAHKARVQAERARERALAASGLPGGGAVAPTGSTL